MKVTLIRPETGDVWTVGAGALIGRGRSREVHLDDQRISSTHAEVCARRGSLVLMARGMHALKVGGRTTREVLLTPETWVELAPGLRLRVIALSGDPPPSEPPTRGREPVRIEHGRFGYLRVRIPGVDGEIQGRSAELLVALLDAPQRARPWPDLARVVWGTPDVARNTFDQAFGRLRQRLGTGDGAALVDIRDGVVSVRLPEGVGVLQVADAAVCGTGAWMDRVIVELESMVTRVSPIPGPVALQGITWREEGRRRLAERLSRHLGAEVGGAWPLLGAAADIDTDVVIYVDG